MDRDPNKETEIPSAPGAGARAERHDQEDGWEEVDVTHAMPVSDDGLSLDDIDEFDDGLLESSQSDDPFSSGERRDPPEQSHATTATGATATGATATEATGAGDHFAITPRGILEAILFVGSPDNAPMKSTEIAQMMRGVRSDEIDEMVQELNESYQEQDTAYEIASVEGGYRMSLRGDLQRTRARFYGRIKEARLSQAAIDVLAIVAYRQPVTRDEVDRLRAKSSGALLNQLLRRQLIRLEIMEEKPRRKLFRTTPRFLQLFGMSDLTELPQSQED